ncbi:hypothetical protein [Pseudoduganella violaceinigra]|uniref:hypothetical protein n=1 Tax=Pseudoduganella violaceinigra TaxID=246602 RepID=UPI0004000B8F|nr:hypothetical protein [Pseudoduganella violaceinigra]
MKKLLLISLLAAASLAQAQEREWITYKKFVDLIRQDRYFALPQAERDKLDFYLELEPVNPKFKAADMNLTVLHAGTRTALPLDEAAHLRMAPDQQWLAENAKVLTTLPKGEKISVAYKLDAVIPEGTQWSYNGLMGSIAQGNGAMKKLSGYFGYVNWFASKITAVRLIFDKPAQLTIQSKNGTKRYLSDAANAIRLAPDAALLKENPVIEVSIRPLKAELDSE